MIDLLRKGAKRIWPVMRLRWVFFGTLLFVAALPGFAALSLNVYENALVRRTEAELNAQSATIAATAALLWPGAEVQAAPLETGPNTGEQVRNWGRDPSGSRYSVQQTEIDLGSSPILPSRPRAKPSGSAPGADALQVAQRMAPVIAQTKQTTLASIILLDANGTVLNGFEAPGSYAHLEEVGLALAGETSTVLRENETYSDDAILQWVSKATAVRLHHARSITVQNEVVGVVLVSRSPAALFRGMYEDSRSILAGTLSIFALLVVLTLVLARAIVAPVEKLSEAAQNLADGRNAALRRPTLEVREISSLFDDFEAMANAIDRRSQYLREFAASLSHEFKTPLAGLRGGIELLEDHRDTMTKAQYERFLANMNGDAQRLSQLVSRLMELAKADMSVRGEQKTADLQGILARLADGLGGDDFAIETAIPTDMPVLAMEGAALETVLGTLIENARQAGATRLTIKGQAFARYVQIELCDNGPGIAQSDRTRIFDPFFTTKRETGGTGLGLPIAQALVSNQQGSLTLAQSDASGSIFELKLPKSK